MTVRLSFVWQFLVALLVLGLIVTGIRPVQAQVSGDSYTDREYGWELRWDGDVWTVIDNPEYELVLWNEDESYIFFQNRDDWGDPEECLDGRVDEVTAEEGVDDVEPLEDEDGDPIGETSNDRAFAAYSLTYTNPDAENARPIARVNAFDCRVLVPDEAVLAITHITSSDAYDDDAELVDDLRSDLDIPEADEPTVTPEDEPTATPEEADESAATPEDEAEPTATPEEEDGPTATPDDDASDAQAPDPEEGIEGNTYTSPTYGYSIEWDEDVWAPDFDLGRLPGRDTLVLAFEDMFGYVYFEAYDAYDGDPEDCLEGSAAEVLENNDVDNIEPYEDEGGDIVEGEEDGVVFAAYTFQLGEDEAAAYFECRTLIEDEAVLAVSLIVPEEGFEEARAALEDLLATLDLDDVPGATTTGDDETPTPEASPDEDGETPTPENGDDSAGVDGNTYESPTYGFTLEWDEDRWEVDEASSEDGFDLLILTSDASTVYVEAGEGFEGDAEACVAAVEDEIADRDGVDDVELLEDDDGLIFEGDEDYAYAYYGFTIERPSSRSGEYYEYVECSALDDGESVLRISQTALIDDAEEEIDALLELLDSVELAETSAVRNQTDPASTATTQAIAENEAQPTEDTNHRELVEVYPGYPGYRGYVTGVDGVGDHACLHDLEAADPFFSRSDVDRENRAAAR
ncbi:MAG TPA: hypothetical protein VGR16_11100 [Thermomicrobiales bacterium]|nr:hypothetical protein [Thermomicrobiales bacterium]